MRQPVRLHQTLPTYHLNARDKVFRLLYLATNLKLAYYVKKQPQ